MDLRVTNSNNSKEDLKSKCIWVFARQCVASSCAIKTAHIMTTRKGALYSPASLLYPCCWATVDTQSVSTGALLTQMPEPDWAWTCSGGAVACFFSAGGLLTPVFLALLLANISSSSSSCLVSAAASCLGLTSALSKCPAWDLCTFTSSSTTSSSFGCLAAFRFFGAIAQVNSQVMPHRWSLVALLGLCQALLYTITSCLVQPQNRWEVPNDL